MAREKEKDQEQEKQPKKKVAKKESPAEKKAKKAAAEALLSELPGEQEVPASELGASKEGLEGSEVNLTSFELMTVSGADAEQINTYLEKESKRRFKKELKDISDEQYDKLLSDKVKFHKWMAVNWVDSFITRRKDEVRAIADEKVSRYGSDDEDILATRRWYGTPDSWRATLSQPEASGVDEERKAVIKAKKEIEDEIKSKERTLADLTTQLEEQHQEMIGGQRSQLEAQGFDAEVINGMISGMEATYAKARADMIAQQQEALKAFKETAESELESRMSELRSEVDKAIKKLKMGTKREMVLTADRWGRVLKKIAKMNPESVQRDDDTGVVSFDYSNSTREQDKIIFDHIDKELDRIISAKSKDAESGIRQHNIEALFQTEEEKAIAVTYVNKLRSRIAGGGVTPKEIKRHHLLFNHLRKQGLVSPLDTLQVEAELGPSYQEQKLSVPSALKEVKAMIDSERNPDIEEVIRQLVKILKTPRSWSAGTRRSYLNDYGKQFAEIVEAIEEKDKETGANYTFPDWDIPWFQLQKTLREAPGTHLQRRLMPTLYRIHTKNHDVISVVRGYYTLPDTLKEDFFEANNWRSSGGGLTEAAADQMRVHFKKWSRTEKGRRNARETIWRMADEIRNKIKGDFDKTTYSTSYGVEQKEFARKMKSELNGMQRRMEQYTKHLEILEQMAGEF